MRLRVATFNVENLLSRYRFEGMRPETHAAMSLFEFPNPQWREAAERSLAVALADDKRQMTALAIAETRADVLALQEVDGLTVLQAFFANYVHRLADIRYGHFALVEGNDRRGIDVAFAARRSLMPEGGARITSNRLATFAELDCFEKDLARRGITPQDRVFNRDCLMSDLDLGDRTLTVFICHFKSMNNGRKDGRQSTLAIRRAEARGVATLIRRRFGAEWRRANWMVLGDLNGYRDGIGPLGHIEDEGESGIEPLTEGFAVDPMQTLPPHERWTHFRRGWSEEDGRMEETHMPLDYVLLSPGLADANPHPGVEIIRRGLPYRVPLDPRAQDRSVATLSTTANRYPRVGWDRPKASDHCPVVVDIVVPRRRD